MKGLSSPHRPRLPFVDQSSDAVLASCVEYVDNPEPVFDRSCGELISRRLHLQISRAACGKHEATRQTIANSRHRP